MNLSIDFEETDDLYLNQGGFTLSNPDGSVAATYDTVVPGGAPLIGIKTGIHKGKRFTIPMEALQKFVQDLIQDEPETEST